MYARFVIPAEVGWGTELKDLFEALKNTSEYKEGVEEAGLDA